MTASKRVAKELEDLQKQLPRYLRDLFSDDADVLVWHALLLPEKPPYNLKAFKLRINFPEEYPFRPPTVKFTTKIYHPNVDSDGQVCLPIISNENWKPCTKTCQDSGSAAAHLCDLGHRATSLLVSTLRYYSLQKRKCHAHFKDQDLEGPTRWPSG
uniref:E2 ubiquitin-conjugating enzyme n=1 Tax=Equus caballus TaxID=9796 RepID=A0A9L0S5C2_HORSE